MAQRVEGLPPLLSLSETAEYLQVSERTVRRYITTGRLLAHKLSAAPQGRVRIHRDDLAAFLESVRR